MIDLSNIEEVKTLQSNVRAVFSSPAGQEVLKFLELSCGWYQSTFNPIDKDLTLINDGKRQVIATIKTLLDFDADVIVKIAKGKND
jgi:hypothetical protein